VYQLWLAGGPDAKGVGGPANSQKGGLRSRCTNYGWPVGPTLKAWGDRPIAKKEACEAGVPTMAGRWARR